MPENPLPTDPLEPVFKCLESGVTFGELSRRSHVPMPIIKFWLMKGVPADVLAWSDDPVPMQVIHFKNLTATAAQILAE